MKKKKLLICILLFTFFSMLFVFQSSAESTEEKTAMDELYEIIPEEVLDKYSTEELMSAIGIEALFSEIFSAVSGSFGKISSFFATLLFVAILISLSEASLVSDSIKTTAGVVTVSSLSVFYLLYPVIMSVKEALYSASAFFSGLIPIISAVSAASGSISTAGAEALNMNVTFGIISTVCELLLLPMSFLMMALALAEGFSLGALSSLAKGVRSIFTWILGIASAFIVGSVAMQGIAATAVDAAKFRAARQAANGLIPIVGSTVSSALSAVVGGLIYAKSIVGVTAVSCLVVLAISPLVTLLLYRLSFSLSITLMDFLGAGGGVRSFSAFRSALDTLIAVYTLSMLVYTLEIIVFMKCGVSAIG